MFTPRNVRVMNDNAEAAASNRAKLSADGSHRISWSAT